MLNTGRWDYRKMTVLNESLHMTIIDTRTLVVTSDSYEQVAGSLDSTWMRIDRDTIPTGSLWVIARNWYDPKYTQLVPFAHDIIGRIRALSSFKFKNMLVVYREMTPLDDGKPFAYGHFLIPFFVKSLRGYYFDKDSIREPHIFKGIEWGKRKRGKSGYTNEKNGEEREKLRYSPKGRDPGNVFYKTQRNAEGYILAVNETSDTEILEKLIKVSSRKGEMIGSNVTDTSFQNIVEGLGRKLTRVELSQHE
jgi:hypothetical protein